MQLTVLRAAADRQAVLRMEKARDAPLDGVSIMIRSREEAERYLRERFEQTLPEQLNRYLRARVHQVIPHHFFSNPSAECRELLVAGHYYGCISLAQAVAEGLSTFLAAANRQRNVKDPKTRVNRLAAAGAISSASLDAFGRIWGEDRNDYHHLNPTVETDYARLQGRALDCIDALYGNGVRHNNQYSLEMKGGASPLLALKETKTG